MREFSRRRFLTGVAAAGLAALFPGPALALTLDEARSRGLVGELPNGYVAARRTGPGVSELVDSVNRQRRQHYRQIAQQTGVPVAAVEQQAGQALIERLPAGAWYMNMQNQWVQK